MRKSYVQINGQLYDKDEFRVEPVAPEVMPDIKPYRSMATGEIINSRSRHREHLKDHGYVEVGNDSSLQAKYKGMPQTNPQQLREILRAQVNDMTHAQFKAAGRRDLERLRWQTNGIPDPLKEI